MTDESWDLNSKPRLTLDRTTAPTAPTGRWILNWVITHWSSSFPKADQIKKRGGALQISRANSSDLKETLPIRPL